MRVICSGQSLGIQTWKFSGPGQVRDAGNGLFIFLGKVCEVGAGSGVVLK